MTPDLDRVKRNIKKMIEGGAQEAEIDGYLATEGVTPSQLQAKPVNDGFQVGEMLKNIPGSAKNYAGSVIQPFLHPVDTINTFRQLGLEGTKDAFIRTYKDRYGSVDKALQTLEQDPVGALADLSFILTGPTALAAKAPGMVGKAGSAANRIAKAIEPLNVAKGGARSVAKLIPETAPISLYESSAKFSTTLPQAKRAEMAGTALKYGALPTGKGMDKISAVMQELDGKITSLVDDATKAGRQIPKAKLYQFLGEAKQSLGGVKVAAPQDLRQFKATVKAFDKYLKSINKSRLTPNEVQAFKRDAYKHINFDRSQGAAKLGAEEARKAMARGAKSAIEDVVPEAKGINEDLSKLIDLQEPLSRAAGRIGNRDITGIMAPLNIGAGTAAGGAAGGTLGLAMSLLERPTIKARIARRLYNAQQREISDLFDYGLAPTLVQQGAFQVGR